MLGKMEIRTPPGSRPRDGRHCDLCGCSQPAVRCDKCGCQIFCLSCDDMYHRHPKRRFHLRKAVDPTPPTPQARPVLPVKVAHLNTASPGDPSKMPLPPPRKKKSLFGSFRKPSPSSDNSPPLPKKEYSWTDRLGSIKKFMSNRPLPPLPNDESDTEPQATTNGQPTRGDLSFIHRKSEERPPQLPQRSPRSPDFPGMNQEKENRVPSTAPHMPGQMRNGSIEPSANHMNQNPEFQNNEENHWNNMQNNQNGPQNFGTLNRQDLQRGFAPPGMPGYPGGMHQSSSATDLHNMQNADGAPGSAQMHPHFPHYPMNPHMPPHYPYPMYPQYPGNYPQYYGSSFANLSNVPTSEGDFSDDHSETASRHSSRKQAFRKRAKRSQSVMMDRMGYPGQFYPFGPYPGYGPWGAPPMPMDAPPSPASSVRSLNRSGRARRRKKVTSEEDDEEFSVSSSPLSRPKSSSSDPKDPPRAPLATQTTSSEDESEGEPDNRRMKLSTIQRRQSDPQKTASPIVESKRVAKLRKSSSKQSDSDAQDAPETLVERRSSRDSNTEQPAQQQYLQASAAPGPSEAWECKHCTFINPAGNRICQVCCKTATPRTDTPVTPQSRPTSAAPGSRKQSVDSERGYVTPDQPPEVEEEASRKEKQDMASLNSALDEAEKQISRGLEELMKLKDDIDANMTKEKNKPAESQAKVDTAESPKPVYKSSGRMRTSILDKLNLNKPQTSNASVSTSTDTQTGQSNWTSDRIIEARRPSNSSASDAYNSPIAQSPELGGGFLSNQKRDSSCQTQQDSLVEFLEKKKAAEEAFLGRPVNNFGFGYGDRMDMMTSPVPSMYDRFLGGGYGMMQRSHSRASLFTGRMNDLGPVDYGGGFGYPMYRSVSRGSLSGDYPDGRMSEFNLRKPDFYLSMEELVERRRQENIRAQGLELVRMIREAEQQGFNADDIQVALTHCGKQNPLEWLQENWRNMVDSVLTLSTNYGNDKKENDIGLLSENEARDALRLHKGNIWAAVTECVEGRQRKYLELSARGNFSRKDIVDSLTSSDGDVEMAYAKLTKSTGKPFLMRIWGSGEGIQNQDGARPLHDDMNDLPQRYLKDETVNSDELSEEIWSEDGDWDDDEDDYERGDLEELQTCREDLHTGPQEMRTPESDKSDYCDPFPTDDRNASSPSDDIFFVIPDARPEKKKGFLSKLVALRKNSKEQADAISNAGKDELCLEENQPSKEDSISQNSASSSEQAKSNGALNALKNTLSAIKDTVTGGVKNDKKLPCAQPEKRTIIVRGQIDHESLNIDSNDHVQLNSIKAIDSDILLEPAPDEKSADGAKIKSAAEIKSEETKDLLKDGASKETFEFETSEAKQLKVNQKDKELAESERKNVSKPGESEIKLETKKPLSLTERLKFAKQTRTPTTASGSSDTQNENITADNIAKNKLESVDNAGTLNSETKTKPFEESKDKKEDNTEVHSIHAISMDPNMSAKKEKISDQTSSTVISSKKSPVQQNSKEEIKGNQEHISIAPSKSREESQTTVSQNAINEPSLKNKPAPTENKMLSEKNQFLENKKSSNEIKVSSPLPENQRMKVIDVADKKVEVMDNTSTSTKEAAAIQENDSNTNTTKYLDKSQSQVETAKTDVVSVPDSSENLSNFIAQKKDSKTELVHNAVKIDDSVKMKEHVPSSSSASINNIESNSINSAHTTKTKHASPASSSSDDVVVDKDKKEVSNDKNVKSEVITLTDIGTNKPLKEATNEKDERENEIIYDIPKSITTVATAASSNNISETSINAISDIPVDNSVTNAFKENSVSQEEVSQATENKINVDSKNFAENINHSKIESVKETSVSNTDKIPSYSEEAPQSKKETEKKSINTSDATSIANNNEISQEIPKSSLEQIPEDKSLNSIQKTENSVFIEVSSKNNNTEEINLPIQSFSEILPENISGESNKENLTTQQESITITSEVKTAPEKPLESGPSQITQEATSNTAEENNTNFNAPSTSQSSVQSEVASSKDNEKTLQEVAIDSEKVPDTITDKEGKKTTVPTENKNDSPSTSFKDDSKVGRFKFSKSGKVKKALTKFEKSDSESLVRNKNQTTNVTPSTFSKFSNKSSTSTPENIDNGKSNITSKNDNLPLLPTTTEQSNSEPLSETVAEKSSPGTVGDESKIPASDVKMAAAEETKPTSTDSENKTPSLDTASDISVEVTKNNTMSTETNVVPEENSEASSAIRDEVKTEKIQESSVASSATQDEVKTEKVQEIPKEINIEEKTSELSVKSSSTIINKEKEPLQEVKLQEPVTSKEFPGNKNNVESNLPSTSNSNASGSNTADVPSNAQINDDKKDVEVATSSETLEQVKLLPESQNATNADTSTSESPKADNSELHNEKLPIERSTSEDNSPAADSDDTDLQYSDDSRPSSVTPPNPIDTLRSRFEGLAGVTSVRGPNRPQSPFRRMSLNSRKQVIALEKIRDAHEKPWYHQKIVAEPVRTTLPKRTIKQQLEIERRVRQMVSDRKVRTYRKAEIVVQLVDLNFEEDEAIQAASECSTLEQALSYLQQECQLCAGHFPVSQIVSMTHCQHRACRDCIRAYFTVQIRDRTILDLLCPFCNEPDIGDEDIAQDYFNHLDIMLKKLVSNEIHELFQRKLRDRVLMKDPNFRWCSQCSSGFIAMPNLTRLVCPDCNAVTCASCRRLWEREHQGISCEAFAALKDATDPEAQAAGLAKMLTEDGIACPSCHFKYALAKGGCMHFRCIQCQHDFCSGCSRPFKMGQKCGVSEFCAKLGLHAHHPRNCLFYLRDKEPEDLQKLLDMNDVKYNTEPPDSSEEIDTCQVMEQKETADGMLDDYCGKEVQEGYAGLCRIHYVEYLGQLVNKHKVDPIQIFDNDDLELVLRRANIRLPARRYRENDVQYREKLVNLIQEELPLDKMDGS